MDVEFWKNRRVLVTGHTGFKGSWLAMWLWKLGAKVTGYSLPPPTKPNLFDLARVEQLVAHNIGDVCDVTALCQVFQRAEPELVFHLAAQPLVRRSYQDPVGTFSTNVLGTVHLLEAVRHCEHVRTVIVVTTDKCYENKEWVWGYRENDPLGGVDPYSASKACAEIVVTSYRRAFFGHGKRTIGLASVRAGNVIGGGDWAEDRLIPDAVRAAASGQTLQVRYPQAVRPWQHVLEPLRGYLMLAERLFHEPQAYAQAWNFGPQPNDAISVAELLGQLACRWKQVQWHAVPAEPIWHESSWLHLDCSKARQLLGWKPCWTLAQAVDATVDWYRAVIEHSADARELTLRQVTQYQQEACP